LNTCLYCSGSWRPEASCNVTIRIPGRGGAGGCVAMSSEAARTISMPSLRLEDCLPTYAIVVRGRGAVGYACLLIIGGDCGGGGRSGEGVGKGSKVRILELWQFTRQYCDLGSQWEGVVSTAGVLLLQHSSSEDRPTGIQRELRRESEAVLTLAQFPRHIDAVVE